MPSHAVFLCLIYPVVGFALARLALGYNVLPLLFPLAAGFALVGPFAALGLYEMSRRREAGLDVSWKHALDVFRSPSIGAIAVLGLMLVAIFLVWIAVAQAIYVANFGYTPAASMPDFLHQVLTTPAGWALIIVGNGVGFLFAVLVLTLSVVSFPLLLDRDVGAATAILTSVRAVLANPFTMAVWGLIVAALLAIGSLPALLRAHGRAAGARPRDLASLSPRGRAGRQRPAALQRADRPRRAATRRTSRPRCSRGAGANLS